MQMYKNKNLNSISDFFSNLNRRLENQTYISFYLM